MSKPAISVRNRLILVALLPLTTVLTILLLLVFYWGNAYYDRLLTFKVNSDLAVAHQYFTQVVDRTGHDMLAMANSQSFAAVLERGDRRMLQDLLVRKRKELHLDFIRLLDGNGKLMTSSLNADIVAGRDEWPVVRGALGGRASTAIDIYSVEQLDRLDPAFARQARLELVATANAAADSRTAENRGMVIHNATPALGADDRPRVILEGGILLNQNLDFVDTINKLVYTEGSLPEGSHGTATLFLGDVRIATNVRLFGNQRALGTRVSEAVRGHVLGEGRTWLDRAFVVSDWYISAYEPIRDSFGKRVGMLYVGYLEEPFAKAKKNIIAAILVLFAIVSAAGFTLSLRVARGIFRPLARMNNTMSAVEQGDPAARTGPLEGRDEIGRLACHLDELLDKLQAQNVELKTWGDELDAKVAARTRELETANQKLRDTQRQLALSEKLAAIGEITAGVAHEINNPVAVIQGNLDLLREVLGPHAEPVAEEIRLIDQQIQRINVIVTKLLQFARPDEFAGYLEQVDCNDVVADCVLLVRHLLQKSSIELLCDSGATALVTINRNELQQVLINLMVNAIHAMPDGGRLRIVTKDAAAGIVIDVIDNGVGISQQNLDRIFDAFFSTKHEQGTGLGLSISYTIVARYGGSITVESQKGCGSTFTVTLPRELSGAAKPSPEAEAAGESNVT
jgi:signal transduction histidine kinase